MNITTYPLQGSDNILTTLCAVKQLKTAYFSEFKKHEKPHKRYTFKRLCGFCEWRRRRDLNPRTAFDGYTISNRARSARLRDFSKILILLKRLYKYTTFLFDCQLFFANLIIFFCNENFEIFFHKAIHITQQSCVI